MASLEIEFRKELAKRFKYLAAPALSERTTIALFDSTLTWHFEDVPHPMLQIHYTGEALLCNPRFYAERIEFIEFVRTTIGTDLIIVVGSNGVWRIAFHREDEKYSRWTFEFLYPSKANDYC